MAKNKSGFPSKFTTQTEQKKTKKVIFLAILTMNKPLTLPVQNFSPIVLLLKSTNTTIAGVQLTKLMIQMMLNFKK